MWCPVQFFTLLSIIGVNASNETPPPNPRSELYSEITSGERAFLASANNNDSSPYSKNENDEKMKSNPLLRSIESNKADVATEEPKTRAKVDIISRELQPLAEAQGIISRNNQPKSQAEIQHLILNAERGSADSAYFLGLFHLYGLESLTPDETSALSWFRRSAEAGHNDAQCAFGLLLYHGHRKVSMDKDTAASYFRLAAESGHSYGRWLLGRSLYEKAVSMTGVESKRSDEFYELVEEAAYWFNLAADEVPEAAHQLAVMLEYSLISGKSLSLTFKSIQSLPLNSNNFLKAAKLYEIASQRGHVESTYNLGLMLVYGRNGLSKDYLKAAELFKRAATDTHQPHVPSMRYLAIMLANGYTNSKGIPDYAAAIHYYELCINAKLEYPPNVRDLCINEHRALSDVYDYAIEMAALSKEEMGFGSHYVDFHVEAMQNEDYKEH